MATATTDSSEELPMLAFEDVFTSDETKTETPKKARRRKVARPQKPAALIAEQALRQALGRSGVAALRAGGPTLVIVQIPTAAWETDVAQAIRALTPPSTSLLALVSAKKRFDSPEASACETLAQGHTVVCLSPAPERLVPAMLRGACDLSVVIPSPDPALVTRVIARWCGAPCPKGIGPADLAGLDLPDLAGALRPGGDPASCIARLRRSSGTRVLPHPDQTAPLLQDLHGYGPARDWGLSLVADLAAVQAGRLSARALESAVLYGPPGTGKTSFARSLARTAGVRLIETSIASWFAEGPGYLDSVIKQANAFFDALVAAAPNVIGFIDELDALPNRAKLSGRGLDWWTPVVTGVLMRVEQVRASGVVLLAATNHVANVDTALLRPGRFDRQFEIGLPDEAARIAILRHHLGDDLPDADLTGVARLAEGATGAVLAGHVTGARQRARLARRRIRLEDLVAEIAPADSRSPEEQRLVAIHEAAHAVISLRLGIEVVGASILRDGRMAGSTRIRLSDRVPDRAGIEAQVVGLLAGRAADQILGRGPDAGAASDLREATRLVAALHGSLGLGDTLAHRAPHEEAERLLTLDRALAETVESDLQRLMEYAASLVRAQERAILTVAEALVQRRALSGTEIATLVGRPPW